MSITYKVRFVNFDGFEFDRAPTSVFVIPKERSFECFIKELKVRAPIVKDLECPRHFKIFYIDNERDKIEVKDEYDFRIFVRKRITNVTAEYQLPQFDDFDEFAEYVKCFTPDGRFPGL